MALSDTSTQPAPAPEASPLPDACPLRHLGCRARLTDPTWRLAYSRTTAEGEAEYCRCSCGSLVVLRNGDLCGFINSECGS
ncbi:hypothetical protein VM98_22525 [Streptomyces rubellomurinus subsp. indigoferus]|nr:hypothetical protein VM98_22525 [Streptomyces rubellomurinus subsp. indigoferus]